MDLLIGLFPSLMFGSMNVLTGYIGGNPRQQNLGLALGAGSLSLLLLPLINNTWDLQTFILGFFGAVFWSCGQVFLLLAFKYQGISRSMPVIVGVQLVQNALVGVLVLGEWRSTLAFTFGSLALTLIIGGIYASSWHEKASVKNGSFDLRKGMATSVVSGMFYAIYPSMFQYFKLPPENVLGPMGISILTCGIIFTFVLRKIEPRPVLNTKLAFLVVPGMMWAMGNLALLTSSAKLGVATGFTLSQLGVVISTLGGIYVLGEKRTKKEMGFVFVGILLVVSGGILLGVAKSYDIS